MENLSVPFLIIFSVRAFNGLFLSLYFYFRPGDNKRADRWLAGLLWIFNLRLSKLVTVHFFENIHVVYDNFWYSGLAATGILLYMYIKSLYSGGKVVKRWPLHFILPILFQLYMMFSPWRQKGMISFQIAVYTLLVYSAISFRIIIRLFQTIRTQITRQWLASIIVFFSAELILFTTFLIKRYRFMQVEAILFFLMIYLFVFSELRWKIVQRVHRNMISEIDGDESLNQRLIQSME